MRVQSLLYKSVGLGLNLWSLFAPERATRKAIELFATPPAPRLREKERAFLDAARPVRQSRGRGAGRPIVEYHWGEAGRPLVLLSYGWGSNAGRWRHYVPTLVEAGYRVLAYDPPGHGQAPRGQLTLPENAAIVADLIAAHGPVEAILAHSFGGSSSVYAVQGLPVRLRPKRMVVMASFSYAPRVFQEYRRLLGLWPTLYWRLVRHIERRFGVSLENYDMARLSGGLADVEALLVHDPADPVTRFAETRRYHSSWPGSALLRAQDGGHHLGHTEITEAVLDFLQQGALPATAERQEAPIAAGHDLVRYFAGL